jgi:hypothetical protein
MFEQHTLTVNEYTTHLEHILKIGDRYSQSIKFINIDGKLLVTGDYGNYVFDRCFVPDADNEGVSVPYWLGKLRQNSCQKPCQDIDFEMTNEILAERIADLHVEAIGRGLTDEEQQEVDYYIDMINYGESNVYMYVAEAINSKPDHLDSEALGFISYKLNPQIQVVFDAFNHICKLLKQQQHD